MEKVAPFEVGQEVHVMQSIMEPRLGWSNESPASVGKIVRIDMDGALNVSSILFACFNFAFHFDSIYFESWVLDLLHCLLIKFICWILLAF